MIGITTKLHVSIIFIEAIMLRLINYFPARVEGIKRKHFDLNIFFFLIWKKLSSPNHINFNGFLVMEELTRYVCTIDDEIDITGMKNIDLVLNKDSVKYRYRILMESISQSHNMCNSVKKQLLDTIIDYINDNKIFLREYFSSASHLSVKEFKHFTTGEMGKVMCRLLNISHQINNASLELAFKDTFIVCQYIDDYNDYEEDQEQHCPNLFDDVAKEDYKKIVFKKIKAMDSFPNLIKAVPYFFFYLSYLTRRRRQID